MNNNPWRYDAGVVTLEHGDFGCGIAQLLHMPGGNYRHDGSDYKPKDWAEMFLNSPLWDRHAFTEPHPVSMASQDFALNGVKDGKPTPHMRTVREWLFEWRSTPATMVVLGTGQRSRGMGEGLEHIGFKLIASPENPIMGYAKVYVYLFPAVKQEDREERQQAWNLKLAAERKAMGVPY